MSFKNFIKEVRGVERVEGELVRTILYSLVTSFVILGLLYFIKFRNVVDFMPKYGFFLFFASLTYSLLFGAFRQVRAYVELTCMGGMMVGMTFGMIAGFLSGFLMASTNGMFVGSVFGMGLGIIMGIWTGKCCGVMGVMEGIMAGFMGGLMGAMTAFMLFNDHLKTTLVIVFVICTFIIFGLNYMIYKEMSTEGRRKKEDYFLTIILTIIFISLTAALMIFGPRTGVFAG